MDLSNCYFFSIEFILLPLFIRGDIVVNNFRMIFFSIVSYSLTKCVFSSPNVRNVTIKVASVVYYYLVVL